MPYCYFHNILQLLLKFEKKIDLAIMLFPTQVRLTCVSRAFNFFVCSFSSRTRDK